MIKNPILRGFNPDPSIVRHEDDYYIATSTFEWFPGVQIHHSKDLCHWRLLTRPLHRVTQLDLSGAMNSGGVWAPDLSYKAGLFYLVYTNVKSKGTIFKDTHNYLVTTDNICGAWSDPVYLNSSGFDPSLFHDADGKIWLLNMLHDHRKGKNRFAGIIMQEYAPAEKRLIGDPVNIFKGTELGKTEGPHLYRFHGYYYLLTAEGGTGYGHAVTVARSRSLFGPYEVHPDNPLLTSADAGAAVLQKAGHGDIVETQNHECYLVHLCSRPLPDTKRCTLGRETAIRKLVWGADLWPRLEGGGNRPLSATPGPALPMHPWPETPVRDDFDAESLSIHFQSLRVPLGEDSMSLQERKGFLRLKGRESLSSKFVQCLVARRQQAFCYTATTCVEFAPVSFQQMAGLICLYDTQNFYYLHISHDEAAGKVLRIISAQNNAFDEPLERDIVIAGWGRCYLRARVEYENLRFYYSPDSLEWTAAGPSLDASTLSDEFCSEGQFTGAFVGICCQDLSGRRLHADFDFFEYAED